MLACVSKKRTQRLQFLLCIEGCVEHIQVLRRLVHHPWQAQVFELVDMTSCLFLLADGFWISCADKSPKSKRPLSRLSNSHSLQAYGQQFLFPLWKEARVAHLLVVVGRWAAYGGPGVVSAGAVQEAGASTATAALAPGDCAVGALCQGLSQRAAGHRRECCRKHRLSG